MIENTKKQKDESVSLKKQAYKKPMIESEKVFERTALACDRHIFVSPFDNPKESSGDCGYADS